MNLRGLRLPLLALLLGGAAAAEDPACTGASCPPAEGIVAGLRAEPPAWDDIDILGRRVRPGDKRQLRWSAGQSFSGESIEAPVIVLRGATRGPALCLTAAVHGDELNGVEIVRRLTNSIDTEQLAGTIIGVPIVNLIGFTRGSRYLPDRRDLNRFFPGNPAGSSASRIAHGFFEQVIRHCDYLVDFHTGSLKRTNLPQLRADLGKPMVHAFAGRFGATNVLHKPAAPGTLRGAATDAGIPAVTFELGAPGLVQAGHVSFGERALETLIDKLGMVRRFRLWDEGQRFFYESRWVRADHGGILNAATRLGARIRPGDLLGVVINPLTSEQHEIRARFDGTVLGMALDQFVLPGFALFNIGLGDAGPPRPDASAAPPEVLVNEAGDDDFEDDTVPDANGPRDDDELY